MCTVAKGVHCPVSSLKSNMFFFSVTIPCNHCTYPWSKPPASVTYITEPLQPEALFMPLLSFLKLQELLNVYASSSAVQEKHRDPRGQLDLSHHYAQLQSGLDPLLCLFVISGPFQHYLWLLCTREDQMS